MKKKSGILIKYTFKNNVPFEDLEEKLIKSDLGHHFSTLFRPLLKKAKRKKRVIIWNWKLQEEKQHPDTYLRYDELLYEFRCFEELGENDLKVFLRLVQVTGLGKVILDPWIKEYKDTDEKLIEQLSLFSSSKSEIENSRIMPVIRSEEAISYNSFFRYLVKGRVSKKDLERFKASLKRLASTTVFIEAKRNGKTVRSMGSNLISFAVDEFGRFLVAVNPFIANAILGNPLGGYRPLIDGRVFQLKGTAAIVLTWLSAWLLPGKSGKVSLDRLEEHIYGDKAEDKKVRWKRRRQLRKALDQISKLNGWEIQEVQKGIFKIKRNSYLKAQSCSKNN